MVTRATRLVRADADSTSGPPQHEDTFVTPERLHQIFDTIRAEADVRDEFEADVLAEADQAAGRAEAATRDLRDERGIEFITIDPPGAMDLDQALHIEVGPDGEGWRVRYAIADLPVFVENGGAVDTEARLRGQTLYCPDRRIPLHPTAISEGVASLLPEQDCPAYVWDIVLDGRGKRASQQIYRALVRSRRRYTYEEAQEQIDAGTGESTLMLLREVGQARIARESERGGASLPMPEQVVSTDENGNYQLEFRPRVIAEEWNAQISLLAGIAAARVMLDGGIGILRTMPPPSRKDQARFRRQARALGVDWPSGHSYGDLLRDLDGTNPRHLALIHDATSLFRGAAYTAFDGQTPEQPIQAALGIPYSHTTAPLRRLVDRFVLVVCESLSEGRQIPDWARAALTDLPDIMRESDRRTRAVERACTEAVEAAVLAGHIGAEFEAVVVDDRGEDWQVQVTEPAVDAHASGTASLGDRVTVRLVEADPKQHTVRFEIVEVLESGNEQPDDSDDDADHDPDHGAGEEADQATDRPGEQGGSTG